MKMFEVISEPLDINKYHQMTINEHQGAVCTCTGHVREWTKGTRTVHLEYEAYNPMAAKMLNQISDIAVVIVTSSPHRTDSYRANEYAVERLKEIVPIWKKEIWEDGEEWIGDSRKYHSSVEEK